MKKSLAALLVLAALCAPALAGVMETGPAPAPPPTTSAPVNPTTSQAAIAYVVPVIVAAALP